MRLGDTFNRVLMSLIDINALFSRFKNDVTMFSVPEAGRQI